MLSVAAAADGCGDSLTIAVLLMLVIFSLCLRIHWTLAIVAAFFGSIFLLVVYVQCQTLS